jgi:hypothetical protein
MAQRELLADGDSPGLGPATARCLMDELSIASRVGQPMTVKMRPQAHSA